ncbi:MAG: 2,3-diketo-5-methylthio-1-phosphopentane phosphatase [Firmicutes bacterium HGW-Firmicutes-5]|nr:MAG: 2,3-diketo-5-methylthio-1-phosphopentane phosphatase [Firmicutes bacterium HGW-Firmicutes-5]
MKDHIFISDFDGTITLKDFYWIIIDDYIGEKGRDHYLAWKKKEKIGLTFLNKIFTWHKFSQADHDTVLSKVAIDPTFKRLDTWTQDHNMDLMVLSAGFRYYIDYAMDLAALSHIPIITNEGSFINGHFKMQANEKSWFYHKVYGVDKQKVVLHYKKKYKKVYFAGDSEPDYKAALSADIRFAKGELLELLKASGHTYYPFETFADIIDILESLEQ